ncbi:MAG TPA: MFS transporter [Rickettsiales bacterium]|nr:MFS transporter [Rickettsiales bacterium]
MRRVVAAGMIGNGLEWYDFALYGYFAPVIGKLFFPGQDVLLQMIATFGVFAAGFVMRPLGAVFFGYLGDKFGRKFSLTVSMFMMAFPTAAIGMLPTYEHIGIWAPLLLTFIRLLQGLSLAGQFSGSITFVVEHAPIERRGIVGSTTVMSLCAGMLLGSLTATICSSALSKTAFETWGWRIPFLLGLGIAIVGLYIRHGTEESPHYEHAKKTGKLSKAPVAHTFQGHVVELLRGIGVYFSVTVPFYTLTVFSNSYMILDKAHGGLGLAESKAYLINTGCMVLMLCMVPFTAHLTDIWGRKRVLMWVATAYFLLAIPIFFVLNEGSAVNALMANMTLTLIVGFYIGAVPAFLVELFPTNVRYTGMSIAYNIAAVLGGMTPMIETWLVRETRVKTDIVLGLYVALCIGVAFAAYRLGRRISLAGISLFLKLVSALAVIAILIGPWAIIKEEMNTIAVAVYIMLCSVVSFIAFIGYHDGYKEKLS